MNNLEYKKIIDEWTKLVNENGFFLSNGEEIPVVFWKTFLGVSRTVHAEIMADTYKRKTFSPSIIQTIRFARLLSLESFLSEVRAHIPIYEKNKRK